MKSFQRYLLQEKYLMINQNTLDRTQMLSQ